jgi:flagellar assembly protein FliH
MDPLIRAAQISERAVVLGIRRPSAPEPAPVVVPPPAQAAEAARPQPAPGPDPAWLDAERKKIEQELRRELEARLESADAEARSRGREQGLEEGRTEALREAREQGAAAARALAALAERAEREIDGMHDLIVGLAFEAVCKVLGASAVERDAVASMVREAVSRVKQEEAIVVRMHPQDCALLRGLSGDIGDERHLKVELTSDEKIALGGCIVETEGGLLDARIETQMQRLRTALLQARPSTSSGQVPSTSSGARKP